MRTRTIIASLVSGLILALASSIHAGRVKAVYAEIMGCEVGCEVAAAGWPMPYLVDYPGISVVGSVDLLGALTGEDKFHLLPFAGTALFWTAAVALAFVVLPRVTG